jgi:putative phosphoribosyl transferase
MFRDRLEAGQLLAAEVAKLDLKEPIILALPRGGVPVAAEIARTLSAPLDLVIVRKVGAPGNPELAIAAIVDGNPPDVVLNQEIIEALRLSDEELAWQVKQEQPELERRRNVYRGKRQPRSVTGRTVVLVDDGAATGTTMKVAVRALKRRSPAKIVVALPVAPPDTLTDLAREADAVVCLHQPPDFRALGYHYRDFRQLADDEVMGLLDDARRASAMRERGS